MRLLLVDGDDCAGAALADALAPHGHTVVRSRGGMDLLTSHREYDAIRLDPALADISGLRALRQLRTVSSIPVVVLTDPDDECSVVLALRSGADDCVPNRLGSGSWSRGWNGRSAITWSAASPTRRGWWSPATCTSI